MDFSGPDERSKDTDPVNPLAGKMWLGASYAEAPDLWMEASPISYVGKSIPPILFTKVPCPDFTLAVLA